MAVDHEPQPSMTWKEKLLGSHGAASESVRDGPSADNENEFELLEGDVNMSIIDGIPAIDFLDRDPNDYNRILSQGPWTVYGQYLTVQPWTKHFSPLQPYPSVVIAWIRLPNLLGYLYKRKIIEAIGGLIGKVVKLDVQTDNQMRGRLARLAVYLNLNRPLISQVLVDRIAQCVEYEALLTVCFACGKYGHVKEMCNSAVSSQNLTGLANKTDKPHADLTTVAEYSTSVDSIDGEKSISVNREKGPEFRLWMLVEKKVSRRGKRDSTTAISVRQAKYPSGSRFATLLVGEDSITKSGQYLIMELRQGSNIKSGQSAEGFLGISLNGVSAANLKKLDSNGIKEVNNYFMATGQRKSKSLGSKQQNLFKNVSVGDAINQNKLDAKMQENNEAGVLEKIKSHYNLVFYESEGFIVPKSENTLDPGKHSTVSFNKNINSMQQDNSKTKSMEFLELGQNSKPNGPKKRRNSGRESGSQNTKKTYFALRDRGNCFKSSRNTHVPLAESMVAMAELLSPQVLGVNSNIEVDGANSKSDCNIDPENQV
ncbi:hypothetical protein GOBAR_AA34750 [Gossypium barbadense]|uniref:CCHC-type domain-containing protein n=1 Tax=Gossypium barbadense TaxID=3634 RepID=A0A2P5W4E2_GOSBA|nr:hypothetical protein GOBAR_AA34750 [Gossypium barbadense]